MDSSRKVMLIGWDAADWKVIHKLMDEGRMPNLQKLVKHGVMGNMSTLFPSLSPMLWTTIATGKRPYKHGIHGFTEPSPDGKGIQPMTNLSRKCKAVWNILNQHDLKSVVVGWWPSNPAEPINGVMVSDFFHKSPQKPGDPWNLPKNSVHPESALTELAPLRLHPTQLKPEHLLPFVPLAAEIDQETDSRLASVMKVLCECVSIHRPASYLLQTREWDFAAIYYDAIDHFSHGFMKFHPPQQSHISDEDFRMFNNVVTAGYLYHDQILGTLLDAAGEGVTVILMSDHGFHPDHLRPKGIPTEPAGPAIEHRDFGIFVVSGPGIKQDHIIHGAGLADITPTILSLYGLPAGADMDGRPLLDIYVDPPALETIPSWEEIDENDGQHPPGRSISTSESREAMEQLIALGYIERPDADSNVAIAKCQAELNYNLARAYMDGGLHGEAISLLVNLYNDFPLEFRFGLQLSNALKAMDRTDELEQLVEDLNSRWRVASEVAKSRVREVAKLSKERKKQWDEMKALDIANEGNPDHPQKLARVDSRGKPILFGTAEKAEIRKIRAVARGNPKTLDFLAATIAASKGEFEQALDLLQKAETSTSRNPGFYFQLGNVYLGLNRPSDAERAYLRGLEIDENDPNSLMGLCRTNLENGHPGRAKDFARQAVGLKFHFPLAHFFLGEAKRQIRDNEGAIQSYQTALAQNPNFKQAHNRLAEIYSTSLPDPLLKKQHKAAARELEAEQNIYLDSIDKIRLKPAEEMDFSKILPDLSGKNTEEFLRCLGQPKPIDLRESAKLPKPVADVVVVTGLPRSGTSMMMQMLIAGGLEPFYDGTRHADESNPKGYYESTSVKKLAQVNNWVVECQGKVFKVVAPLVPYLPQGLNYRIVMMVRNIGEILDSQQAMLERLNRPGGNLTMERFEKIFQQQLQTVRNLCNLHSVPCAEISHAKAIAEPRETARLIGDFLPHTLDLEKMVNSVDPGLYRQKRTNI